MKHLQQPSANKIGYCLDTNIVSEVLRKNPVVNQRLQNELDNGNKVYISSIVYYEIVRGLKAAGASNKLKGFMKIYPVLAKLPLDMKSIEKAVDIYVDLHKGNQIEDNDIYIAAIAMANDCTLVTANEKHFSRINNLKYENWKC